MVADALAMRSQLQVTPIEKPGRSVRGSRARSERNGAIPLSFGRLPSVRELRSWQEPKARSRKAHVSSPRGEWPDGVMSGRLAARLSEQDREHFKVFGCSLPLIVPLENIVQGPNQKDARIFLMNMARSMKGAACALHRDSRTPQGSGKREMKILLNTGRLLHEIIKNKVAQRESNGISLAVLTHDDYLWQKGIFGLEVRWNHKSAATSHGIVGDRLLEIDFFVDQYGNLVIPVSQRHLLDMQWRGRFSADTDEIVLEKRRGDKKMRLIREETGLPVEAFGLLIAISALGRFVPSGRVCLPTFSHQPEIRDRLMRLKSLKCEGVEDGQLGIIQEIENLREMTDFEAMLRMIGVSDKAIQRRGPYLFVPIEAIKMAMHYHFTDNAEYLNRHKYRRILSGFERC